MIKDVLSRVHITISVFHWLLQQQYQIKQKVARQNSTANTNISQVCRQMAPNTSPSQSTCRLVGFFLVRDWHFDLQSVNKRQSSPPQGDNGGSRLFVGLDTVDLLRECIVLGWRDGGVVANCYDQTKIPSDFFYPPKLYKIFMFQELT